ncbi:MAG: hypothetical protein Q7W30_08660 [Coriobacteriia bacterium]|nr:hypothetical protein [Coriobacteriia bacterium]
MIEWFGRLPAPARMILAAAALGLATFVDLLFQKVWPWRAEVILSAALGALAAWPFAWRARTRVDNAFLVVAIVLFAVGMVWARVNGHVASSFAFIFSVILVSLPVQRARGRLVSAPPEHGEDR